MEGTTINDLHGRLLRDTFGSRLNDQDAFLIFVLFHTHRLVLSGPVLTDRPNIVTGSPGIVAVAAITQRSVSEALASMWAGKDDKRANSTFWYWRWNGDWEGYHHAEHLTPEESERLALLKQQLERHPFVAWFELEG